jgi:hypothetical protein
MSCNTVTFKRGTNFGSSTVFTPEAPPAIQDLIGVTVTSTIVDADRNEYDLTVVVAGNGLSFTADYTGDTGDWAIGTARWDIKFTQGTTIFYSDTMRLDIIGQVTV